MNYIKSLQFENAELRSALKTYSDSFSAFRSYLASGKFQGADLDGARKDWIATGDVINWLRDVENAIASEIPPARKESFPVSNLDSFSQPSELEAFMRENEGKLPDQYVRYGQFKIAAMEARIDGRIAQALRLEGELERIYSSMPKGLKW